MKKTMPENQLLIGICKWNGNLLNNTIEIPKVSTRDTVTYLRK